MIGTYIKIRSFSPVMGQGGAGKCHWKIKPSRSITDTPSREGR